MVDMSVVEMYFEKNCVFEMEERARMKLINDSYYKKYVHLNLKIKRICITKMFVYIMIIQYFICLFPGQFYVPQIEKIS